MKKIKKSLLALAAFCAITSSANAFTFNAIYKHPDVSQYQVIFTEQTKYGENSLTPGECKFCWYSDCWNYEYIFDGVMTIFIAEVGMYFKIGTNLYSADGKQKFEQLILPTCIHCNDQ